MTMTMDPPANALANNGNGNQQIVQQSEPRRALVVDAGEFANLLDSNKFEHLWRVATLFAGSQLVPAHFQKHPEDCFIAAQMAMRMGVDPFMFMQNTYIVQGRPGMEAKLAIALINSSGLFSDSLDYEIEGGADPKAQTYKVRAFATRKSTGKIVHGPWVDWAIVRAEGWDGRNGSKWKTIPSLMFQYRAASWFGKLHCPERLMGMQTREEIEDIGAEGVMPVVSERGVKGMMTRIQNVANAASTAITSRPVSEGQTFEPAPEAIAEAEADRILREKSPSAQQQPEPPADPVVAPDEVRTNVPPEQEADAGAEAAARWDDPAWAEKRCADTARDLGIKISDFRGGLFKWETTKGGKKLVGPSQWQELFEAIAGGRFDYKAGKIG